MHTEKENKGQFLIRKQCFSLQETENRTAYLCVPVSRNLVFVIK